MYQLSLGLYTWPNLHMYANFANIQYLHTYANLALCTHLFPYAKFARMQPLANMHLPQTKCKSHFAYMQILHIWSCERKAKFAHVSIYFCLLSAVTTLYQNKNFLVHSLILPCIVQLFREKFYTNNASHLADVVG